MASGKDTVLTTEFLRNSTVRPCRGGSDGSAVRGAATERKGVRASDHCPIFLSVGAPAEEPSGPLEHPPKRVRQGKPSGSRRPRRAAGGQFAPSGGLDFIFPAGAPAQAGASRQEPSGSRRPRRGRRGGQFAPLWGARFHLPGRGAAAPREDVRRGKTQKCVFMRT